jgi:hypothetical protein
MPIIFITKSEPEKIIETASELYNNIVEKIGDEKFFLNLTRPPKITDDLEEHLEPNKCKIYYLETNLPKRNDFKIDFKSFDVHEDKKIYFTGEQDCFHVNFAVICSHGYIFAATICETNGDEVFEDDILFVPKTDIEKMMVDDIMNDKIDLIYPYL